LPLLPPQRQGLGFAWADPFYALSFVKGELPRSVVRRLSYNWTLPLPSHIYQALEPFLTPCRTVAEVVCDS